MPRLAPLAHDLWEVTDELRLPGGVIFPVRMTVIRTKAGLELWSPIAIDDALAEELAEIGPVTRLVAPNCFHHLYLADAKRRYPEADLLGAPGLAAKRADLAFDGELGAESRDGLELIPTQGIPRLNEVVALHRPTRTLIVTDLVFHVLEARGPMSWFIFRVVAGTLGRCRQSRLLGWATNDRDAFATSLDTILAVDFDRLVMAHGEVIETGGHAALAEATIHARSVPRRLPAPS